MEEDSHREMGRVNVWSTNILPCHAETMEHREEFDLET